MFQLRAFLRSGRHDAREMLARHSEVELLGQATDVDFKSLRLSLLKCASYRTVLLGAVSPMWLSQCEGTNVEHHMCPRCGSRLANFQHVFYDCSIVGR